MISSSWHPPTTASFLDVPNEQQNCDRSGFEFQSWDRRHSCLVYYLRAITHTRYALRHWAGRDTDSKSECSSRPATRRPSDSRDHVTSCNGSRPRSFIFVGRTGPSRQ
jgi:hypothetical protein